MNPDECKDWPEIEIKIVAQSAMVDKTVLLDSFTSYYLAELWLGDRLSRAELDQLSENELVRMRPDFKQLRASRS